MRSIWLFTALLLSAALAAFHVFALDGFWYWKNVWLDVSVHFAGGVTIGVFLVGFLSRFKPLLYIVGFTAIVVAWEVFEYFFGVKRGINYFFDTTLDLLMGVLGAVAVYVVARLTLWRTR
jgi:hypothetical protein